MAKSYSKGFQILNLVETNLQQTLTFACFALTFLTLPKEVLRNVNQKTTFFVRPSNTTFG